VSVVRSDVQLFIGYSVPPLERSSVPLDASQVRVIISQEPTKEDRTMNSPELARRLGVRPEGPGGWDEYDRLIKREVRPLLPGVLRVYAVAGHMVRRGSSVRVRQRATVGRSSRMHLMPPRHVSFSSSGSGPGRDDG
jgi:hypothetical protein